MTSRSPSAKTPEPSCPHAPRPPALSLSVVPVLLLALLAEACSASDSDTEDDAGGVGGTTVASGGSSATTSPPNGGSLATGGSAPMTSTTTPTGPGFTLLFRDDFDQLDSTRWQLKTHSWKGNLAKFSADSATVSNGELSITLLQAPEGTVDAGETKPYLGAEVRSVAALTYGRVRARAKLAAGSAVVSSLVTIYTPWPADNWNELDIECLGKDPSLVQFNTMVYTGALPAPKTPVSPTQEPFKYSLGFDASADFHTYQIEWTPAGVNFTVDDLPAYTWNKRMDLMTLPQNVLLTIWASSSAGWAGAVNETTLGARAVYDWIELYEYKP